MHVELVAIAVLVVIVLAVIARVARVNSIERSISGHHRRLHSMEEVVHRSRERPSDASSRPTYRPLKPPPSPSATSPDARIDLGKRPVSEEGRLVFGDLSLTPVKPPVPPIYETRRERKLSNRPAADRTPRASGVSRPLAVGSLVVALGAGGGAYAWVSSGYHHGAALSSTTTTTAHRRGSGSSGHRSSRKPKTAKRTPTGSAIGPLTVLSSTATSATVRAPAGTYHVSVSANAPCWVGFERAKSPSGPWLADATIGSAGSPSTAISTSGPLVIAIGAPKSVTSIEVNGVALKLTNLPPEPYDLLFTATAR